MVSSVRKSHFEDVEDSQREWRRAVLKMKGIFGTRSFRRREGEGESSMVAGRRKGGNKQDAREYGTIGRRKER